MAADFRLMEKVEIHATVSGRAYAYIDALARSQRIGVSEVLEMIVRRVAAIDASQQRREGL